MQKKMLYDLIYIFFIFFEKILKYSENSKFFLKF